VSDVLTNTPTSSSEQEDAHVGHGIDVMNVEMKIKKNVKNVKKTWRKLKKRL